MLSALLSLANEILTAAIVVVAVSILLYNLSRNINDRVTRTSGAVLFFVTVVYVVDVFTSLNPDVQNYQVALRLQWVGLAFLPAALFHLSDALLATTGLPSRGRRRLGTRILYAVSGAFLLMVAFTNSLIQIVPLNDNLASLQPAPAFWVYVVYFLSAGGLAVMNVQRARERCLTRTTRRRMAYLQFAMITPVIGTFPFSVLLGAGNEFSILSLVLVNVANAIIILMLIFLSYPLSFFGSQIPDRMVKSELLRFFLQGPATGLLVLATMLVSNQAVVILGIPGTQFAPFAVVTVVLMWQWMVALILPILENYLIYSDEDTDQIIKLRSLSERLLSRNDLLQLMGASLQATCDYLQVTTAFVVWFRPERTELVRSIGPSRPAAELLSNGRDDLIDAFTNVTIINQLPIYAWQGYWTVPLFSLRITDETGTPTLIGVMGIQPRAQEVNLTVDEHQTLMGFVRNIEQTLDDIALQEEVFAAVEGLLPQMNMTRSRAAEVEYISGHVSNLDTATTPRPPTLPPHDQLIEQVRAALRHYWGGPGLTRSRLLELSIVRDHAEENPIHALRAILQEAIERQRPEGERKKRDPEWTLYNILEMRYVQGSKVKDVAKSLYMSDSDLYRKQRTAIEAVVEAIETMETEHFNHLA